MKLIIELKEETYNFFKEKAFILFARSNGKILTCELYEAIANGIPYNSKGDLIEYKPLDADFNTQSAVENLRTAYWSDITIEAAKAFSKAEEIIISAICHHGYTLCKETVVKPVNGDLISRSALKKAFEDCTGDCACCIHNTNDFEYCGLIDNAPIVECEWGKWIISEIQCPNCLGYFQTNCFSSEELKKCPNCGATMKGGTE